MPKKKKGGGRGGKRQRLVPFASIHFSVIVSLEPLWREYSPLGLGECMGTGEYWGAVEMQLCFHVEFGAHQSLNDLPHARQGTPLCAEWCYEK